MQERHQMGEVAVAADRCRRVDIAVHDGLVILARRDAEHGDDRRTSRRKQEVTLATPVPVAIDRTQEERTGNTNSGSATFSERTVEIVSNGEAHETYRILA